MHRSTERLIQLARSVNDAVVGEHIGQICRDLAEALDVHRAALKGATVIANRAYRVVAGETSQPAADVRSSFDVFAHLAGMDRGCGIAVLVTEAGREQPLHLGSSVVLAMADVVVDCRGATPRVVKKRTSAPGPAVILAVDNSGGEQ